MYRFTRMSVVVTMAVVGALGFTGLGFAQDITLRLFDIEEPASVESPDPFVEQFERENPNINVELIKVPISNFESRLQVLMRSPNPPDIIRYQSQAQLIPLASAGLLIPLDNYIDDSTALDFDDFFTRDMVTWNGNVWGIPWEVQGRRIAYNKEAYEELGLSVPTTWEELLENVEKATRDLDGDGTVDQFGWVDSLVGPAWVVSQFGNFMVMNDAHLVNENISEAVVTDEAFVQTLEFYADLNKRFGVPNPNAITPAQMAAAFGDGIAVHAVAGSWWLTSYSDLWGPHFQYGEQWDTFANPAGPQLEQAGIHTASNFGGWAWGITAGSDHPDEAWALMEAITTPEAIAAYNDGLPTAGGQVAATDKWDHEFFQDFIQGTLEAGPAVPALRGFDRVVEAQQFLTDAVHAAILTDRSAAEITEELHRQIEGLIDGR
jgi:multiple sugar transport system substrate-binding protein